MRKTNHRALLGQARPPLMPPGTDATAQERQLADERQRLRQDVARTDEERQDDGAGGCRGDPPVRPGRGLGGPEWHRAGWSRAGWSRQGGPAGWSRAGGPGRAVPGRAVPARAGPTGAGRFALAGSTNPAGSTSRSTSRSASRSASRSSSPSLSGTRAVVSPRGATSSSVP